MRVLDCRGRRCPLPVIELARALPGVAVGDMLTVVADDPAARHEVPAWCRLRAQEYVGADASDDGVPRYTIRRLS